MAEPIAALEITLYARVIGGEQSPVPVATFEVPVHLVPVAGTTEGILLQVRPSMLDIEEAVTAIASRLTLAP